ncbi:MAG TPA: DNA primase [Anaerolineae bacterium]|nr:DNA primase [Anaerolineae bacterium]HIQ09650.1 DNA primase [Anaerolineaceae bacterium]
MDPVEEIKSRLDIVDIVSETVQLRKSGKNYIGFCPFHPNTRTPAFVVFPETGTWHCFGCQKGGDLFAFVMEREGWDFAEALKHLAQRAGVELRPRSPQAVQEAEEHERLRHLLEEAATFFRHHLRSPAGKAALDYLHRRGLTDETIEAWGLGYAPNARDTLLHFFREKGYAVETLLQAGLLSQRDDDSVYDRFRHRVMFPIRDAQGRMAGFGARTLDPEGVPKYLNTPQTPLFDKGSLLYGLDKARQAIRKQDQVVLVEGYMDVIALHQAGYANAVSPMGTALTEAHLRQLKRYTRNIVLALDPDEAGQRAVLRSLEVARETLSDTPQFTFDPRGWLRRESRFNAALRVVTLPEGQDPDEMVLANPQAWEALVAQAQPIVLFVLETALQGQPLEDPKVKAQLAERLVPLIMEVASPVERDTYLNLLARRLAVDESSLLALVPRAATRRRPRRVRRGPERTSEGAPQPQGAAPPPSPAVIRHQMEQIALGLLLRDPEMVFLINRRLREETLPPLVVKDFEHTAHRTLFALVQKAVEQHESSPADYLQHHLPPDLLSTADQLLALTTDLAQRPERQRLEETTRLMLHLRLHRLNQQVQQLRFLLQEAEAEQDPEQTAQLQRRLVEALRLRRLAEEALHRLPQWTL